MVVPPAGETNNFVFVYKIHLRFKKSLTTTTFSHVLHHIFRRWVMVEKILILRLLCVYELMERPPMRCPLTRRPLMRCPLTYEVKVKLHILPPGRDPVCSSEPSNESGAPQTLSNRNTHVYTRTMGVNSSCLLRSHHS